MASFNGNEWANRVAVPAVMNKAYVDGGRVRIKFFSWTTSSPAQNDTVNLCVLPAGAILLSGFVQFEAMGTSATLDIGISGTAQKYAAAINVAAIGTASFLNTAALNFALVETTDENIIATMSGAAWTTGKKVNGYIFFVKD